MIADAITICITELRQIINAESLDESPLLRHINRVTSVTAYAEIERKEIPLSPRDLSIVGRSIGDLAWN